MTVKLRKQLSCFSFEELSLLARSGADLSADEVCVNRICANVLSRSQGKGEAVIMVKKEYSKKKIAAVLLAAILTLALMTGAAAYAISRLQLDRTAVKDATGIMLSDRLLAVVDDAAAPEGGLFVQNKQVKTNGRTVTFEAIAEGVALRDGLNADGTWAYKNMDTIYAIVSIEGDVGEGELFGAYPLIKNAADIPFSDSAVPHAYTENGVLYLFVDITDVSAFADRGLQLAVYGAQVFLYEWTDLNEDGTFSFNAAAPELRAMFDLPLDVSYADAEKATRYAESHVFYTSFAAYKEALSGEGAVPVDLPEDEKSRALTELLGSRFVEYIGRVDGDTLCFVTLDQAADETASRTAHFVSGSKITGQAALPENAKVFSAGEGYFRVAEDPYAENARLCVYAPDGEKTADFVFNAGWSQTEYARQIRQLSRPETDPAEALSQGDINHAKNIYSLYTACVFSADGRTFTWSMIDRGNVCLMRTDIAAGTTQNVREAALTFDPAGEGVPCGCGNGWMLKELTNDTQNTFVLAAENGAELARWAYPREKFAYITGDFAVVCDMLSNETRSSGTVLHVLDLTGLTEREVNVETAAESKWALVSADGAVLLTFDRNGTFRVYDIAANEKLGEFELRDTSYVDRERVFIDTAARTVYYSVAEDPFFAVEIAVY